MSRSDRRRKRERGAALLTAMMLVAVMAVIAIEAADSTRMALRRSVNAEARDQAYWYYLGAEILARKTIERGAFVDDERTTLRQPWAAGPVRFSLEAGGIEGVIDDRANCFNLNSLGADVEGPHRLTGNETAITQFAELVGALGLDLDGAERAVAVRAADWLDYDQEVRSGGGGEDFDYGLGDVPQRAANTWFVDVDEVRAFELFDETAFLALRRYLCVLPEAQLTTVNVNTLLDDEAAFLTMVLGEDLPVDRAIELLKSRPDGGWTTLEAFWSEPALAAIEADDPRKAQIKLKSTFFELRAIVYHQAAFVEGVTLFRQTADGGVEVAGRRFGADE